MINHMLHFSLYIASFNLNQIIYYKYIYYSNKKCKHIVFQIRLELDEKSARLCIDRRDSKTCLMSFGQQRVLTLPIWIMQ